MVPENSVREGVPTLVELLPDAAVLVDREGRIVHVNTQAEAMFGYAPGELVGQAIEVLIPARFNQRHVEQRRQYALQPQQRRMGPGLDLWGKRRDGSEFAVEIALGPVELNGASLILSVIRDLTRSRQGERRLAAQYAVTRILVESVTFHEAAPKVIQEVGQVLNWDVGAIWLVDEAAKVLRCAGFWHQPTLIVSEFEGICRRITFESGIGLPGRVWATRQPAWIPNVVEDTNFPRAPYAVKDGLHGAFGFPIMAQERVFGMIEFFSREIRKPDDALLRMFGAVGNQIGLFTQRKLAEDAVKREKEQLVQANAVMMGREERVLELKHEINDLLKELRRPPKYGT